MKLKSLLVAALTLAAFTQVACAEPAPTAAAAPSKFAEGKDYIPVQGAKGVETPHIYEFFSYTCPHCYKMEGFLHNWMPTKAEEIEFVRVPVFMSRQPHLTQGYYAAEVLGVLDKVHMEIFNAMHRDRKPMRTEQDMLPIFLKAGVSAEDFNKAYNSFAVANKVQYAKKLVKDFKVTSFPRLIVNQKYEVKNYEQLANLLNELPLEKAK